MTVSDFEYSLATGERDEQEEINELSFSLKRESRASSLPKTTSEIDAFTSGSYMEEHRKGKDKLGDVDDKFVQWIGRVLEISGDTFTARLDPIRQQSPSKIARFNMGKVVILNGEQMHEGATFYWTVGLFRNSKGSYVKRSEVRFRLPIVPNYAAVEELAMRNAERLFEGIGWLD